MFRTGTKAASRDEVPSRLPGTRDEMAKPVRVSPPPTAPLCYHFRSCRPCRGLFSAFSSSTRVHLTYVHKAARPWSKIQIPHRGLKGPDRLDSCCRCRGPDSLPGQRDLHFQLLGVWLPDPWLLHPNNCRDISVLSSLQGRLRPLYDGTTVRLLPPPTLTSSSSLPSWRSQEPGNPTDPSASVTCVPLSSSN